MLDALLPAADALNRAVMRGAPLRDAWRAATLAAEQGAAATATMRPRLGRAAYLGDRALGRRMLARAQSSFGCAPSPYSV